MARICFKTSFLSTLSSGLLCLGLAFGTGISAAQAQSSDSRLPTTRPVLGIGFTGGGDLLLQVPFSDGTMQNIYAGRLVHMFLGLEHQAAQGYFFRGTLGYHSDSVSASNGSVSFSRLPLELSTHFYAADRVTLGLGMRKSLSPSLDSTGVAMQPIPMTSDMGWFAQIEYELTPQFSIAGRTTHETFHYQSGGVDTPLDGSHVGLYFNVTF
jgi:hypothetical protein